MFVRKYSRAIMRALSGLSVNISAIFFAAAFIGPNLSFPRTPDQVFSLTMNIVFGILFLVISIILEGKLDK